MGKEKRRLLLVLLHALAREITNGHLRRKENDEEKEGREKIEIKERERREEGTKFRKNNDVV